MESEPQRRTYAVFGVWSRVFWMAGTAAVVANLIWTVAAVRGFWSTEQPWNPVADAARSLTVFASGLGLGDAWAFLGVFAALVVAIQVAASTNQQTRDRIADARAVRFTIAAIATGATVLLADIAFIVGLGGKYPAAVAAMVVASVGIAFFAADGASVVLTADIRPEVAIAMRNRVRASRAPSVPRRDRGEAATLLRATLVLLAWTLSVPWILFGLVAVAAFFAGEPVGGVWASAMIAVGGLALVVAGVSSAAVFSFWWAPVAPTRSGMVGRYAIAAVFIVLGASAVVFMALGGLRSDQPAWATVLVTAAVGVPFILPLTAVPARGRMKWWTPGGSLDQARAAIERLGVAGQLRTYKRLTALFEQG